MSSSDAVPAAGAAPVKRRPVFSLSAVTNQLDSTSISDTPAGTTNTETTTTAAAATSPQPAPNVPTPAEGAAAALAAAASAAVPSTTAASAAPSIPRPAAATSPPPAALPTAASAATSTAATPAPRTSPPPHRPTVAFYVPPNRRATSGSPAPTSTSSVARAPSRSPSASPGLSDSYAPTTAAAAAAPAPAASSSPSPAPAPAPAPARKGLIIDRERQAAIDAAYGLGEAASSAGGSFVSESQVLEVFDLSRGMKHSAVQQALGSGVVRVTAGVDDSSVLVVFATEKAAVQALEEGGGGLRIRSMQQASPATRALVATIAAPVSVRPATDSSAAKRLLAGALGIRMPRQSPEVREEEKRAREERRKKMEAARAREESGGTGDAWD